MSETIGGLRLRMARLLADAFAARNYDGTPALDARLLVAHLLKLAPETVPLHDEEPVDAEVATQAIALAARRGGGEPVARIVGVKEFHGLPLQLSPETLVPRADTETVVDAVLAEVAAGGRGKAPLTILDLGTGSGAILLALLAALPAATGLGIDLAPGAVATAAANAARLGFGQRARFTTGDWTAAIEGRFDIVTSNPPYIESKSIAALAVEVSRFDPHLSLDGGPDGLAAIRAIVGDLGRVLAQGGTAFIEIGAGQAPAVIEIAVRNGFSVRMVKDLAGIERVAVLGRVASKAADTAQYRPKIALGNPPRTG